jgi:hypothetical protein
MLNDSNRNGEQCGRDDGEKRAESPRELGVLREMDSPKAPEEGRDAAGPTRVGTKAVETLKCLDTSAALLSAKTGLAARATVWFTRAESNNATDDGREAEH